MTALALDDAPELPEFDGPPAPASSTLLTCDADGTHHFNQVKKLALSGKQYLHACNNPEPPTRAMLVGTRVHEIVLGPRPGAPRVVRYDGRRAGARWDAFKAANADAEILNEAEWTEAEQIAAAVLADPVARDRLHGARTEVPLRWEEDGGIVCSTTGVDIITTGAALGDLKTTNTTYPESWQRLAFRMLYPQQMAWYARGARANGLEVRGLFLLGVDVHAPYEVVDLELTDAMIAFADRTVALWLEKLRVYRESNQWPGFAQSPVPFDVPAWMGGDDEEEDP